MFLTGLAPNLLAIEPVRKTVHIDVSWLHWFAMFLPVGLVLLLTTPARDLWRLGGIFGSYYLAVFLLLGVPTLLFLG
jgi:hypothetical protein